MTTDWTAPETRVLDTMKTTLESDREAAIATVLDVDGRAYRRPGAKMIITPDDRGIGNITAGCLEDEVISLADSVFSDREPVLEQFDLTGDDGIWGLGVGCNGIVDVLIEPLDDRYEPLVEGYQAGEDCFTATVLECSDSNVADGTKVTGSGDDRLDALGELPGWLRASLEDPLRKLEARETSGTVTVSENGHTATVFLDVCSQPPDLTIFGSGPDVVPVVELGNNVGFTTNVVTFRGAKATPERFPSADRVHSTSPASVSDELSLTDTSYAVVMTHNYVDDRLAIESLLQTPVEYIGLMGPNERFQQMLDDFEDDGRHLSDDELDRIYTPIGIDLGGGAPYQIAHSIVAEILAIHHDRTPTHLRNRKSPLHDRLELEGVSD